VDGGEAGGNGRAEAREEEVLAGPLKKGESVDGLRGKKARDEVVVSQLFNALDE